MGFISGLFYSSVNILKVWNYKMSNDRQRSSIMCQTLHTYILKTYRLKNTNNNKSTTGRVIRGELYDGGNPRESIKNFIQRYAKSIGK